MLTKRVAMVVAVAFVVLGGGEALAGGKRTSKKQFTGVVNLNTATAQQLDLLPGVGEKAAKRIIEYRARTPFNRPEELVKVKGFGKRSFEKLKPYLAVAGPTTLKELKPGAAPSVVFPPMEVQGRVAPRH